MIYWRIYSPARESGLYTAEEMQAKYGRKWKEAIKQFNTEMWDSEHWYEKSYSKLVESNKPE